LVRRGVNPHKISLELNEKENGKFLCGKYVENFDFFDWEPDIEVVKNIVFKINFECLN